MVPQDRVAVCFSGQARSFDLCYPTIHRNLLTALFRQGFAYKIFVHTYRDNHTHKLESLDPQAMLVEEQHIFPERNYAERLGHGQKTGVQGIFRQLHSIQQADWLRRSYELLTGEEFQWVIRMRPDIMFHSPLPDLRGLDPTNIFVPDLNGWGGLCDFFACGGPEVMSSYCDRIEQIADYYDAGNTLHPETYLKDYLAAAQVVVESLRLDLAVCRTPGREDQFHLGVFRPQE